MLREILVIAALIMPSAALAEWKEASSEHFLVYSEGSEDALRGFTEKLEKFDFMLRAVSGTTRPPSPVKLKVYLMRSFDEVASTRGDGASGVAGYYSAGTRGPIAIGVRRSTRQENDLSAETVLLHEYTHHFMFQYFPATYPSWYSEGFAEFYGTTRILDNDVIEVGHPARHRYLSFAMNEWLPLGKMLSARRYADVGADLHLLYAQGWLLVHYLSFNKARSGQLKTYLDAIQSGHSYEAARDAAFGPGARKLDSELRNYSSRRMVEVMRLPFKTIRVKPVSVRTVTPSEDALMWQEIALGRGVLKGEAADFAAKVRDTARSFPDDPYALSRLVEAERAIGDLAAARTAVERLLALRPKDPRGLMHKAEIEIETLAAAQSTDGKRWDQARDLIVQAHKTAPTDPLILEAYYRSFGTQGIVPPIGAQNALFRALELVPQDEDLRYTVAWDYEQRGMIEEALTIIRPLAFQLHDDETDPKKKKKQEEREEKYREVGEEKRESAREMLDRLEKKLADSKTAAL